MRIISNQEYFIVEKKRLDIYIIKLKIKDFRKYLKFPLFRLGLLKFDACHRLSSVTRRSMLFHGRGACVHEPHVRVRSTRIPASTCFYEYRGKRNIITKNGCQVYTLTCRHPSSLVSRVVLGQSPKEIRSRDLSVPSFLLPSTVQAFPPFILTVYIVDLHGFRDSTLG